MAFPTLPLRFLFVNLLAAAAAAQSLWIVDGQNRPGAHFTDLPAAEAAARDGDVISVRSDGGVYSAIQTQKALTIVSDIAQATIRTSAAQPFSVSGIPAGRQFALRGFVLGPAGSAAVAPVLQVSNCTGRVLLSYLEVALGFPSISISACAAVLVQESRAAGGFPAIAAQDSVLECVNASLQGGSADLRFLQSAMPAVDLLRSHAVFNGCNMFGGLGRGTMPPSAALVLTDSVAEAGAVGGLGSLRAGGAGVAGSGTASAVTAVNSSLRLDPALPVVPTGAQPPISGSAVTVAIAQFPGLVLDTHLRSATYLVVRNVPGALNVLIVGFPAGPIALPGIAGLAWIDPHAYVTAFPAPAAVGPPLLPIGTTLVAQIAALSPTSGAELSNPSALLIR